ncbi:MAG: manganese efflux pump MntP family protein [Oscillospiraceae bacterium]
MDLFTLFLLALGLSMDAFAVSVSNSMCFTALSKKQALSASFTFGVFQGVMPLIGFAAGRGFTETVSKLDHWICLVLLAIIGGKMLFDGVQSLRTPEACPAQKTYSVRLMLMQGVATSIDALAVGISLASLGNTNIWAAAGFIGVITFICCVIGHFIGKKAGGSLGNKAQILGGFILIAIGVKTFIEHTIG